MNTIRIHIGYICVDSGQIILGDPAYLKEWGGHEYHVNRPGEYSYAGACSATMTTGAGILGNVGSHPNGSWGSENNGMPTGLAAAVATGYGDGCYPVIVTYNDSGRISAVSVLFE